MKLNPVPTFQIKEFKIIPQYYTVSSQLMKSESDSLIFVEQSVFLYYPFGKIKVRSKVNSGLLKNFSVKQRIMQTDIGEIVIKTLTYGTSKIILFYNKTTPGKYYDIYKFEINNPNISLVNDVKPKMNIADFYNSFFDDFPNTLKVEYKVFEIRSFEGDIKQDYSIANGELQSVKFASVRWIKIDD